jgi:hypothetical protein
MYISVQALVGCICHNESSVHGHESFKINMDFKKGGGETWTGLFWLKTGTGGRHL